MMRSEENPSSHKDEDHVYCDKCRREILVPFLGHQNTMGFEDICIGCYDELTKFVLV